jgi:hypothetical protein
MRTNIIRRFDHLFLPSELIAADWAIDFFLAKNGPIHRTKSGLAVFGTHGVSSNSDSWAQPHQGCLARLIPLYWFSSFALKFIRPLSWHSWSKVFTLLVMLNIQAVRIS